MQFLQDHSLERQFTVLAQSANDNPLPLEAEHFVKPSEVNKWEKVIWLTVALSLALNSLHTHSAVVRTEHV